MGPQSSSRTVHSFELEDKRAQIAEIEAMIIDFQRLADDLDQQIDAEQRACGITDVNHFAYPTFARAAIARRDNLKASITELRTRLEQAKEELAALEEQVKSAEAAEGLNVQRFAKPAGRRKSSRLAGALGSGR